MGDGWAEIRSQSFFLGVPTAIQVTGHVMQSLLFGVGPTDPVSFAGVATLVMAIAIAATLVPSWQAVAAQTLASLREEWGDRAVSLGALPTA